MTAPVGEESDLEGLKEVVDTPDILEECGNHNQRS